MKPSLSSRAPVSPNRSLRRRTGFLGRPEFYNALRIVTVAQSKRELTPEMVKAALHGPAAAKIPAPEINLAATPAPQFNSAAAAPSWWCCRSDILGKSWVLGTASNTSLPTPIAPPHSEEKRQANQQKPRVPELEKHLVNQLTAEELVAQLYDIKANFKMPLDL
ncbi:unnamed protein product [Malus baccata var. baccata]